MQFNLLTVVALVSFAGSSMAAKCSPTADVYCAFVKENPQLVGYEV